ncbi:MAG: hypothetical protein GEV10_27035 [Streptosporangiales bacterium]|nr:hypothetical protein [Streptosporangiales bacterium]
MDTGAGTASSRSPALTDVRVLELSRRPWSSTTLCGRVLADLGADVVRVVDPGSPTEPVVRPPGLGLPPERLAAFSKRAVAVELSDVDALRDLCGRSDVVLLDRETLALLRGVGLDLCDPGRVAPHVVVACLSPFGLTGPWRDAPGSELTVQAVTGMMTTNGYPGDPPVRAGIPVAACGGALLATAAILAALYERAESGLGQFVDHAEHDSLIAFLGTLLPGYFLTGRGFTQIGNHHAMAAPWNSYCTLDGWVLICTMSDSHFRILAHAIGRPEIAEDSRFLDSSLRVANVDELDAIVEAWTRRHTTEHITNHLSAADIAVGPITTVDEALVDPQARHHGVVVPTADGIVAGPVVRLNSPTPQVLSGGESGPVDAALLWIGPRTRQPPGPRDGKRDEDGPLRSVTVVEVCSLTAGPLVGRFLGMLGATVVKIEPSKGEGSRHLPQKVAGQGYLYYLNNTDKLGVTLDMGDPLDRARIHELVAGADAFLTNMAPSTLAAHQLAPADLLGRHRDLVYCGLTGFGQDGPYGGRKLVDTVAQAFSGIMSLTGFPEREPLKVAVSIADLLTACAGTVGLLAGLLARQRTGEQQHVDPTLYDTAVWATQEEWWRAGQPGRAHRLGNRHSRHAPHNLFPTGDRPVAIAVETDEQWARLAELTGHPELAFAAHYATARARVEHVDEVEAVVRSWLGRRAAEDVVATCWAAGVPAAVPLGLSEIAEGAHTAARGMVVTRTHPKAGPLRHIGSVFTLSRTPAHVRKSAPELGEHNALLLGSRPPHTAADRRPTRR